MSDYEFEKLVEEIQNAGGRPFLVGGYVRDHLLHREMTFKDRDLEVFGLYPNQLKNICRRFGRVMTVGAAFAVLKVILSDDEVVDVSIPRRETWIGEGHKGFDVQSDPFMTIREAAERRDLTINAISMEPITKEIIDPLNGIRDLEKKLLRHVSHRFEEDPLRVLRVLQFSARLGFSIAVETRQLCTEMVKKGSLSSLPRERIEEEFKKLLCQGKSDMISRVFKNGYKMGIWRAVLPELDDLYSVKQDSRYHSEGNCFYHTVLTVKSMMEIAQRDHLEDDHRFMLGLAALGHDLGKKLTTKRDENGSIIAHGHEKAGVPIAQTMLRRITSTRWILESALALIAAHMRPLHLVTAEKVTDAAIRRLANDVHPATLEDLARLVEADTRATMRSDGQESANAHIFLRERAGQLGVDHSPPKPVFQGRDLMRLAHANILPERFRQGGPHYKTVLDAVYEAQLDGHVNDIADAEKFAIDFINTMI